MTTVIVGLAIIGGIIVLVNLYQAGKFNSRIVINGLFLLLALMTIGIGGFTYLIALDSVSESSLTNTELVVTNISTDGALALFIVSLILGVLSIGLIYSRKLRLVVQNWIVRSDGKEKRKSADSVVHTLAILLMFFASVFTVGNFIIAGGIEGLAEEIGDISSIDLLSNLLLYVGIAVLGVGLFVRRDIPRTLKRLGIRLPESGRLARWFVTGIKHLTIGTIVGFGMFWVQVGLSFIWQLTVPPETVAEQSAASQALFTALSGSLWLGFLVAFTAGVGEELLFRGALQPIFGNIITSIFFVMLHSQYILTPASLIIFVVSIIFGFVRSRYTTPAAMMAHFIYNFTPFVLIAVLQSYGISLEQLSF
ncbi:MAG: CPBP family intramembrane glutamic endopeptidase [Chloroflexota bacterium]